MEFSSVVAELRAKEGAGERPEDEAAGNERVGFGVIAAENLLASEFDGVVAADQGDVVRELVAAENREIGKEYIGAQIIREAGDLQSHLLPAHWGLR